MKSKSSLFNPVLWLVVSLSLGLSPFSPEPHVWEKIQWVLSGAEGMKLIDWFDLFLHGSPWLMLIISAIYKIKS